MFRRRNVNHSLATTLTLLMCFILLSSVASANAPITRLTDEELHKLYSELPFTDILPLPEGPILIGGEEGNSFRILPNRL